jgi:septal ring factor EnvC (AmiA/AmiB activator)
MSEKLPKECLSLAYAALSAANEYKECTLDFISQHKKREPVDKKALKKLYATLGEIEVRIKELKDEITETERENGK